jgi:hypothetical protein
LVTLNIDKFQSDCQVKSNNNNNNNNNNDDELVLKLKNCTVFFTSNRRHII